MRPTYLALAVIAAAACAAVASGQKATVDYPTGYRAWQHMKTMLILPGHSLEGPFGGIHHVYANPKALAGLKDGAYEYGAFFVLDLLGYEEADHVIVETNRKRVDVMQYGRERFAATGSWGFETFAGDSTTERVLTDGGAACFSCHESLAEGSNYVISKYRP